MRLAGTFPPPPYCAPQVIQFLYRRRRAAFWIQSPLLFIGLLLIFLKVREPDSFTSSAANARSAKEKLMRIDYIGIVALTTALGSLLIGMSFKSSGACGWSDSKVWGFLIVR